MHDHMISNNLKGTPADLRGLALLGQLSGKVRTLALDAPQDVIESPDGIEAIIKAIVVSDPVADTQRLHNAWQTLHDTTKNPKETFLKHVMRFLSKWGNLQREIKDKTPPAMKEQVAFQFLDGSGLEGSNKAQELSSAMSKCDHGSGELTMRVAETSIASSSTAADTSDPGFVDTHRINVKRLPDDAHALSKEPKDFKKDLDSSFKDSIDACKTTLDTAAHTDAFAALPDDGKSAFANTIKAINVCIVARDLLDEGIEEILDQDKSLSQRNGFIMSQFKNFVAELRRHAQTSGSVDRTPLVAVETMSSALLALDGADFTKRARGKDHSQSLLGALNNFNKKIKKKQNTDNTKVAPRKTRGPSDKSNDT